MFSFSCYFAVSLVRLCLSAVQIPLPAEAAARAAADQVLAAPVVPAVVEAQRAVEEQGPVVGVLLRVDPGAVSMGTTVRAVGRAVTMTVRVVVSAVTMIGLVVDRVVGRVVMTIERRVGAVSRMTIVL